MNAAIDAMPGSGTVAPLLALGLSPTSFYRRRQKQFGPLLRRPTPPRALSVAERREVLEVLHSERFADKAPAEVVATLLEEGRHLASERTMYRILADNEEVRERRNQLCHPVAARPELVATAPNSVWSWDITKLMTTTKFVYLHLYVIIDIFSRYVVGWLLAERESAALAKRLVDETVAKHNVAPGELTLHADRGAAMRSKLLSQLLGSLDVGKSFNRPHVSNDNPFSESHFKTLKYHPSFPSKFGGLDDGLAFCRTFFPWYNEHHHHSGIEFLTPATVHSGRGDEVLRARHETMMVKYRAHPERFVHGPPRLAELAREVYINPPKAVTAPDAAPPAHAMPAAPHAPPPAHATPAAPDATPAAPDAAPPAHATPAAPPAHATPPAPDAAPPAHATPTTRSRPSPGLTQPEGVLH